MFTIWKNKYEKMEERMKILENERESIFNKINYLENDLEKQKKESLKKKIEAKKYEIDNIELRGNKKKILISQNFLYFIFYIQNYIFHFF
jgi:hypothetical protein